MTLCSIFDTGERALRATFIENHDSRVGSDRCALRSDTIMVPCPAVRVVYQRFRQLVLIIIDASCCGSGFMPDFDAIIIGTGQTRPSLAFRLLGAGMKVAVVERRHLRQYRLYPDQGLVASAYAARIARRATEYGVMISGAKMPKISRSTAATLSSRRRKQWQSPASGGSSSTDLYECRRPGGGAANARHKLGALPNEFVDDGRRFSAAASRHCRRQLDRTGIRRNVPPLWQPGDDHRNGAAPACSP